MFLLVNLWLSKNKLFSNKYVYLCCPLGYLETNEYILYFQNVAWRDMARCFQNVLA